MSVTAYANVGGVQVAATMIRPGEANEARTQQACGEAIDAAQDSDAASNRRDAAAGQELGEQRTALDELRDQPGALDRFA